MHLFFHDNVATLVFPCCRMIDAVVRTLLTHSPKSVRLPLLVGVRTKPNNKLDSGGW